MNELSLSGKIWVYKKFDSTYVNYLKENYFLDEITARLLSIRNIDKKNIQSFLKPSIKNLVPNPMILKDMDKTITRILKSIKNKEKIGIFGDYDVDGASSTALLGNYFRNINQEFEIYIPDRKSEGYGPSKIGFQKLLDKNVNLIITVDCGTMSYEPIDFALNKKVDVIVLDHHQSELSLPNAFSIINPNRFDDSSDLNHLCAAGVCFMTLISLNSSLRKINWFTENNLTEPNLLEYLDLVSLGTICDVVPLIGLNRAFVKQGLKVVNQRKNLGLKTLIDVCKINNQASTYHLGYIIGPRINAGGRVGKCSHGAQLLINKSPKESFKLANELEYFNSERKKIEDKLLNIVLNTIDKDINDPVLILQGNDWHEGIIGIIASRIKDRFNKPTIIISFNNSIGKASARSIVGFDIGSVLLSAVQDKILIKGGGHKMAGGFSIHEKNIKKFKEFVFKRFYASIKNNNNKNIYYLDGMISSSALNYEFFKKIEVLSPFGSGNPEPKFLLESVRTIKSQIVGDKHIKSILSSKDGSTIKTISFNSRETDLGQFLLNNKRNTFNIAGKLSLNEWKGEKNVEFIIDDISVNKAKNN